MSEQVSSFIPVEAGEQRYLFFFVTWNDFVTPITEELRKHREAMVGRIIGGWGESPARGMDGRYPGGEQVFR